MDIGDFIRSERNRLGLSQRSLAKALHVSPGAVAQWELNNNRPTFNHLADICAVFGASLQSFLQPGSPYYGAVLEDEDEIALIASWRRIEVENRKVVRRMIDGLVSSNGGPIDDPKNSRKA